MCRQADSVSAGGQRRPRCAAELGKVDPTPLVQLALHPQLIPSFLPAHPLIFFSTMSTYASSSSHFIVFWSVTK